ncbi:MAG: hypothetical protein QOK80_09395, partial [Nitrososphaeraceae archaeon]|nr:hypothetical protein [Nitrososphaeraceae archaeon]
GRYKMVKLETAVSLASLGLVVMFILQLYSFIYFLIGSMSQGPDIVVQPEGVIIQIISISAAPGVIMAGIAYGLVKDYGSKIIGIILCISGTILLIGIVLIRGMISKIPEIVFVPAIIPLSFAFLAAGVGIIIVGIIAFMREGKRQLPIGEEYI